ncbi:glycoside hydrolase family 108 protein [Sphingobium yanoikuyae]|uniref:glycoside hydrolase family 108 protein n=1 Tax=Sphingobium yanoikuyae TaxID=13690 RepID=UPI0026EA8E31|nr:glycosyl hydrolase 108 family protein [Sphingobium yanoikuyae]
MNGENSDIVVEGWTPRYAAASAKLRKTEGLLSDDPLDRGGTTKYGISLRFLVAEGKIDLDGDGRADFDLDMDGDIDGVDVRKLTWGDAKFLYLRCFWLRLDADSFARPVGEMLFDQAVNGGLSAAKKMLQRAVNACLVQYKVDLPQLNVDGDLGDKSRAALDAVVRVPAARMPAIIMAYREVVKARYRAIAAADPSQKRFLNGWLNRADELGRD